MSLPSLDQPFVVGSVETQAGKIPRITHRLGWADHLGSIKARWGVGRMNFKVDPGLYALGNPDEKSKVFVTANYKMSFDRLREALVGRDAWILVLDTDGINVWCAAGKGTFGTEELVRRIDFCNLAQIVMHRELILPQLSGPGVAAHLVKKGSGFKVIYGPIESNDLPRFLDAGCKATSHMRKKTFSARERTVLVPVELVGTLKWSLMVLPCLFVAGGFAGVDGFWESAGRYGLFAVIAYVCAVFSGAVLTPILLPWLPGRAFSFKGLIMGIVMAILVAFFWPGNFETWAGRAEIFAWFFLIPSISAFLAMNFTGASSYTSLSGVRKEMEWAVPLEIVGAGIGLLLWILSLIAA
ncbi:MAG: acetyl-CoA synthase subunit gamma [Deltaproteobacteria bacterium]|nr:acetyl-CoA synthase subunit gamma [Deltaproteobacteria bacterium]